LCLGLYSGTLLKEIKMIEPVIVMAIFFALILLVAGPQAYRNWRETRKNRN
jgi:hypothetical protein